MQWGTNGGKKLICVCFILFFPPISPMQHKGGSQAELHFRVHATVGYGFPFTASTTGGVCHHLAHHCLLIQLLCRLSQISSSVTDVAIWLHQTRCSFQTVWFPLACGFHKQHGWLCFYLGTVLNGQNLNISSQYLLISILFSLCDYILSLIRFFFPLYLFRILLLIQ